MLETKGNIFDFQDADAICFTSCGITNSRGELVMGAGVAKAFKDKWPFLPSRFGRRVSEHGNHVYEIGVIGDCLHQHLAICSFPTKEDWRNPSILSLIIQSAKELMVLIEQSDWQKVLLPRPGVGLGGLDWETQVKPAIQDILDDRVTIVSL